MEFIDEKIEQYVYEHTQDEGELLTRLQKETYKSLEYPQMVSGRTVGRFLKLQAQLLGARRILEVGTFSGYSALSMAEGLPEDGRLFTCDEDPPAIAVAKRYFAESPHGHKITLLEGKALDSIAGLHETFDMAFIDADKVNYLNYFNAILPIMRTGGLIVVDNVLWSGRVLDPKDESDHAIHNFNETVCRDKRVEVLMLAVRDGLYCLRKK
ncbi:MAG: class I SAM-dependent methyltransferase [Nitrospinae bacterium]|nr:class I SAM-dependent methyltransferase [Nitrospinota bacterium]